MLQKIYHSPNTVLGITEGLWVPVRLCMSGKAAVVKNTNAGLEQCVSTLLML